MEIRSAALRACTQGLADPSWKFARAEVPRLEGWVLQLTDDAGHVGLGYAHTIPAITTHGSGAKAALDLLAPMLIGRRPDRIAATMADIELALAGQPSVKAAIDMALHDLLARRLGTPVHALLGGRRRDRIPLARILSIKPPAEMAARAATLAEQGYRQLKLKLAGDTTLDVARVAAVRDAVGPDVVLTLDPNQSYSAKQTIRAFACMERHDIALIEQPVPAADWAGLALLTRTLPVDIEADESAQTVHDVFRLVADRVVDVINLRVTKLGGLRRFAEAVAICEAGGVGCRVGAAFGPSLLQAASAHAASLMSNLRWGCELAEHQHLLDDPFTALAITDGLLTVPTTAGVGVDWAAAG